MIEFWIAQGVISLINLFARSIKQDISLHKTIKMFNEHGYDVNKKYSAIILRYTRNGKDHDDIIKSKLFEKYCCIIPFINFYYLILNVKYLCGNHTNQRYYDDLYNWDLWLEDNSFGINNLENENVIKQQEKNNLIESSENKLLEKKNQNNYNNNYQNTTTDDTLDELYRIKRLIVNLENDVDKKIETIEKTKKRKRLDKNKK